MKIVLKKEIDSYQEMVDYIKENKLIEDEYRFAVIGLITDNDDNIILQRRGPKARDAAGVLADVGGAYEESDKTFRQALSREIQEEMGDQAEIIIEQFVAGSMKRIFDPETNKDVNWLFLAYKCKLIKGKLLINEPGKCNTYEYYKRNELPEDRTETSIFFWDYYFNKYNKCYSYAMGVNDKIYKLGKDFIIEEDEEDYQVTFSKDKCLVWEKFIEDNMEDGFWNEYLIDDEIRFMFKEDGKIDKYILNKDNNQELLERCRRAAEVHFASVRSMYENTTFYKDKIDGIVFYD